MIKIGWKCLKVDSRGEMVSAIHVPGVVYPLHEVTRPRRGCGPLTVFKTLKVAEHFGEYFGLNVRKVAYSPLKGKARWYKAYGCASITVPPSFHSILIPDPNLVDPAEEVVRLE